MKTYNYFNLCLLLFVSLFGFSTKGLAKEKILYVGAIPDQNPEKLNRLYSLLTQELSNKLKVKVKYVPVTNYPATVTAFRTGSLDLVWFGGLTGVQARLQRPGAIVLAQRDIDKKFHTVFIANKISNIPKIQELSDLRKLKGKRFTFGSESSTSGRLMPQYFLEKAGVKISDFKGKRAGFSGSHDTTIVLVQSGSFEAGALNEQVWKENLKKGKVDKSKVKVIWKTPPYPDYHWIVQPNLDKKFGPAFTDKIKTTLLNLDINKNKDRKILDLFGAGKFVSANKNDYKKIEEIGRKIGKIR